jgi:hypothetical protein
MVEYIIPQTKHSINLTARIDMPYALFFWLNLQIEDLTSKHCQFATTKYQTTRSSVHEYNELHGSTSTYMHDSMSMARRSTDHGAGPNITRPLISFSSLTHNLKTIVARKAKISYPILISFLAHGFEGREAASWEGGKR